MGEPIVEGRGGAGDPVAPPGRHESRADPEAASGAPAAPSGKSEAKGA
ncbi:hypothetical protein ACFPZ0_07185 [Streptomonospora nanhaiensis]